MLPLFLIKKPPENVYFKVEKLAFFGCPSPGLKAVKKCFAKWILEAKVGT